MFYRPNNVQINEECRVLFRSRLLLLCATFSVAWASVLSTSAAAASAAKSPRSGRVVLECEGVSTVNDFTSSVRQTHKTQIWRVGNKDWNLWDPDAGEWIGHWCDSGVQYDIVSHSDCENTGEHYSMKSMTVSPNHKTFERIEIYRKTGKYRFHQEDSGPSGSGDKTYIIVTDEDGDCKKISNPEINQQKKF